MNANCNKCKHYFITFNQQTPKGCRAFKIQSAQLPSVVVKAANGGNDCLGFEKKKEKERAKDLSDSRYW